MTFQSIQAMNPSSTPESDDYVGMSEMEEALREAERTGYVFDPDNLEGVEYDPDSIRDLLGRSDGSV